MSKKTTIYDLVNEQSSDLASMVVGGKTSAAGQTTQTHLATTGQLLHRMQFHNVMKTKTLLKKTFNAAYQKNSKGRKSFDRFAGQNLKGGLREVYFTQMEMDANACVVLTYQITDGTLAPISLTAQGQDLISTLKVPQGFEITADTTIGEVSTALLPLNKRLLWEKDQVSIVYPQQYTVQHTGTLVPHASLELYEFVLNRDSTVPFRTKIPEAVFAVKNGFIGTAGLPEPGALAYVISRTEEKRNLISGNELVITPDNEIYEQYTSEAKKKEALESYASAKREFYNAEQSEAEQEGTDTPIDETFAVNAVILNGTTIPRGSGALSVSSGNVLEIKGTKLTDVELKVNALTDPTGDAANYALSALGSVTMGNNTIRINVTISEAELNHLFRADTSAVVYRFT